MNATIGGRYKFLADDGKTLRADIEANVDWENWGKTLRLRRPPATSADLGLHEPRPVPDRARLRPLRQRRVRAALRGELRQPRPPGHVLGPPRRQLSPAARRHRRGRPRARGDPARRRRVRHGGREGGLAARELRRRVARHDHARRRVPHAALGAQRRRRLRARGHATRTPARRPTARTATRRRPTSACRGHHRRRGRSTSARAPTRRTRCSRPTSSSRTRSTRARSSRHYLMFMLGFSTWF